jgi:separase
LLAKKGRQRGRAAEVGRAAAAGAGKAERGGRERSARGKGKGVVGDQGRASLVEAVRLGRDECYLKYLNGAAMVVYGIPVYLDG